ncbi:MAG: hypothetical protein ACI9JZ_000918 [Lentimonas sp.]|jgi:hypothetical protein
MVKRHEADPHRGSGTVLEYYDSMMQWHGVKLESAKRSYLHLCCRQFGSASKITIPDACEYMSWSGRSENVLIQPNPTFSLCL